MHQSYEMHQSSRRNRLPECYCSKPSAKWMLDAKRAKAFFKCSSDYCDFLQWRENARASLRDPTEQEQLQIKQERLRDIKQKLAEAEKRCHDSHKDWGNEWNEVKRLETEKFLIENDIPYKSFTDGVVVITTTHGERMKLALKNFKVCLKGSIWQWCSGEKLLRMYTQGAAGCVRVSVPVVKYCEASQAPFFNIKDMPLI